MKISRQLQVSGVVAVIVAAEARTTDETLSNENVGSCFFFGAPIRAMARTRNISMNVSYI